MGINDVFNGILALQSRPVSLQRFPADPVSIKIAPTNFSRYLEGVASTTVSGSEFIISVAVLAEAGFTGPLKKKDRLIDAAADKTMIIEEVDFMYSIGGEIIAYRVRTG